MQTVGLVCFFYHSYVCRFWMLVAVNVAEAVQMVYHQLQESVCVQSFHSGSVKFIATCYVGIRKHKSGEAPSEVVSLLTKLMDVAEQQMMDLGS